MTVELSSVRVVRRSWGRTDLLPWSEFGHDGVAIGELWFQRADRSAPEPRLLFSLLFTDEPLSIEVRPDDDFARLIGLPSGASEAWCVLSAVPGARVALGLKRELTRPQLRAAIADQSIAQLVQWRDVATGDVLIVPAGTIHAVGAGVVLAKIEQRCDVAFRLFDDGRQLDIDLDGAVASAVPGPVVEQPPSAVISEGRNVLAQSGSFVLEAVEFMPNSHWQIDAGDETWMLVLDGEVELDRTPVTSGEAMFLQKHRGPLKIGDHRVTGLMAYVAAAPLPNLLVGRNGVPIEAMIERFPELGTGRQMNAAARVRPWGIRS
jgi:mannose-6-phosphate isomerase